MILSADLCGYVEHKVLIAAADAAHLPAIIGRYRYADFSYRDKADGCTGFAKCAEFFEQVVGSESIVPVVARKVNMSVKAARFRGPTRRFCQILCS